ncbi:hypothetical protein PENTCL1PPCAC_4937, partial [Pristionchus entomophagus]
HAWLRRYPFDMVSTSISTSNFCASSFSCSLEGNLTGREDGRVALRHSMSKHCLKHPSTMLSRLTQGWRGCERKANSMSMSEKVPTSILPYSVQIREHSTHGRFFNRYSTISLWISEPTRSLASDC